MTEQMQLKQGFKGEIAYKLIDSIDISDSRIKFNFSDLKDYSKSIHCKQGSAKNEVVIPFLRGEADKDGRFQGEFVIEKGSNRDIYPVIGYITVKIRKCI